MNEMNEMYKLDTGKADGARERFMARVDACAIIAAADHAERIATLAEKRNVAICVAARMYVWAALKRAVLRGSARNRLDALEALEAEQVESRAARPLAAPSALAREVSRIEARTGDGYLVIRIGMRVDVAAPEKPEKRVHARRMAPVYGSLYVQYDDDMARATVDYAHERARYDDAAREIEDYVTRYLSDFFGQLSASGIRSIRAVLESDADEAAIATAKIGALKALRNRAEYVYTGFPARNAVTCRDFVHYVKVYGERALAAIGA